MHGMSIADLGAHSNRRRGFWHISAAKHAASLQPKRCCTAGAGEGNSNSYSAWKAAALPLSYTRAAPTLSSIAERLNEKSERPVSTACALSLDICNFVLRRSGKCLAGGGGRVSYQSPTTGKLSEAGGRGWWTGDPGRAAGLQPVRWRSVAQSARAPVSKTGGWGVGSLHSCHSERQDKLGKIGQIGLKA